MSYFAVPRVCDLPAQCLPTYRLANQLWQTVTGRRGAKCQSKGMPDVSRKYHMRDAMQGSAPR